MPHRSAHSSLPRARASGRWRASALRWGSAAALAATTLPNASAQGRIQVDHYTADDGLAQNTVRAVVQDAAGFVWVGTSRGLQRFNGYSFTAYDSLDREAPPELSGLIWSIGLGPRGMLWVHAADRLFEVDPKRVRATQVATGVARGAWTVDSAGVPWVFANNRLARVDTSAEPAHLVVVDSMSMPAGVRAMATGRGGAVWLVGHDERGRPAVVHVRPTKGRAVYALDAVVDPVVALEDAAGRVWVGGSAGLDVLDVGADRFRAVPEFRRQEVSTIEASTDGLLVATATTLARINARGAITRRLNVPQALPFLPQDLTVDRDGGIWLATYAGGLFRLDDRRPTFEFLSRESAPLKALGNDFVTALHERRDGTLWLGTLNNGAYRLAPGASSGTAFRHDPVRAGSLWGGSVWDFAEDDAGQLWVGTTTGMCKVTGPGFLCHGLAGEPMGLVDIARARDRWFWIARANDGAIAFDPSTGRFGDAVSLPGETIMAAYVDPDSGTLWLGGTGLFRVSISNGKLVGDVQRVAASARSDRIVYAIFRDSQRALWLGTELGLQRWDATRRRFAPVDVPELRGSTAFSVHEDADQRLWVGTAHGLVAYSPATGIARRYRREDGVRSGEFNRRAALRMASGDMLFGGVQGITRFHPSSISGRRDAPAIAITRLRKLTASGVEDEHVVRPDSASVRLLPGDRAVTIEFAALSFRPGPLRRYRYRLEGLSDEWIETSDHIVTYPTPPAAGTYLFHVQAAAGSEGAWSPTTAMLSVEVIPPFWRTGWFRATLVLTTGMLLWLLHRLRLARAVATERMRLRISRDLHDQIGAGLSSIALLSDSVGNSGAGIEERDRRQLRKIAGAARDMVGDLRDIVWSIDPDADRLEDIVGRMRDVADDLLRGIAVTFNVQPGSHLTRTVTMGARRDLLLLYKEALHNIARHSRASAVTIALRRERGGLELVVSDDGVGFVPDGATSGVGLRSLRERAERLGAQLDLESAPGRGTSIRIQLPTS